jgi:hypothetical protein
MEAGRNNPATSGAMGSRLIWIPVLVQLLFLLPAIHATRDILDVDSVAYARTAQYYLNGQFNLAINGYFGPLLSWVMVPFLWLSVDPVTSSIMAMGVSAVVFQIGAILLLRALGLSVWQIAVGVIMSGLFAVSWAAITVVPDLLAAGLLLTGMSFLLRERRPESLLQLLGAALFFSAATLAKAVMLPTAVAVTVLLYFLRWIFDSLNWRKCLQGSVVVTGFILAILSPWFATLSIHYGKPVISTSAAINHAIIRKSEGARYHVFERTYHKPEQGRITAWEDPSREAYDYWSAFDSKESFQFQLSLAGKNFITILKALHHFGALGAGLILAFGAGLYVLWMMAFRRRVDIFREKRWLLSGPLIATASAVYLPVFADAQRYYLVAYPMMLGLALPAFQIALRWLLSLAGNSGTDRRRPVDAIAAATLVLLIFSTPYVVHGMVAWKDPFVYRYNVTGREIATILNDKPAGALATAGDIVQAAVLAAFHSGRPYYGNRMDNPSLEDMIASGARYLIVEPGSKPDDALRTSGKVREIASRTAEQAARQKINKYRLYEVLGSSK